MGNGKPWRGRIRVAATAAGFLSLGGTVGALPPTVDFSASTDDPDRIEGLYGDAEGDLAGGEACRRVFRRFLDSLAHGDVRSARACCSGEYLDTLRTDLPVEEAEAIGRTIRDGMADYTRWHDDYAPEAVMLSFWSSWEPACFIFRKAGGRWRIEGFRLPYGG